MTRRRHRGGFTLVELLVVVMILAILTTLAVRSLEGLQDQSRFDATRQGLREIDDAVVGPAGQLRPDGTPLITGFVADMGRLPAVVAGEPLEELWVKPAAAAPLSIVAAPAPDNDVLVETGWRGPYLRLGAGATGLRDGWGNPYIARLPDGTTAGVGAPISQVASLGADNLVGGTLYDADPDVKFAQTVPPTRWSGNLTVEVVVYSASSMAPPANPSPADGDVEIKYFGPNGVGGVAVLSSGMLTPTGASPATAVFSGVPIGPRVVRATQGTAPATVYKSLPTRVVIPAGGTVQRVVIFKP